MNGNWPNKTEAAIIDCMGQFNGPVKARLIKKVMPDSSPQYVSQCLASLRHKNLVTVSRRNEWTLTLFGQWIYHAIESIKQERPCKCFLT